MPLKWLLEEIVCKRVEAGCIDVSLWPVFIKPPGRGALQFLSFTWGAESWCVCKGTKNAMGLMALCRLAPSIHVHVCVSLHPAVAFHLCPQQQRVCCAQVAQSKELKAVCVCVFTGLLRASIIPLGSSASPNALVLMDLQMVHSFC